MDQKCFREISKRRDFWTAPETVGEGSKNVSEERVSGEVGGSGSNCRKHFFGGTQGLGCNVSGSISNVEPGNIAIGVDKMSLAACPKGVWTNQFPETFNCTTLTSGRKRLKPRRKHLNAQSRRHSILLQGGDIFSYCARVRRQPYQSPACWPVSDLRCFTSVWASVLGMCRRAGGGDGEEV